MMYGIVCVCAQLHIYLTYLVYLVELVHLVHLVYLVCPIYLIYLGYLIDTSYPILSSLLLSCFILSYRLFRY